MTRDSSSVYDRLYKTSTASSKNRKEVAEVVPKNILLRDENSHKESATKAKPSLRKARPQHTKKITKITGSSDVFNRLYSKQTASSVSKRSTETTNSSHRAPMKPKNQS